MDLVLAIPGTDYRSAIGLFVWKARSCVRKLGWVSVASLFASILVAVLETPSRASELLVAWSRYLWVLPLSVTISSISLLVANLVLGSVVPTGVPRKLLSGAYLMNGPSMALLSASTLLGIATPAWVEYVTPAILLMSAWAYYLSLGPPEEDDTSISRERLRVEDEIWGERAGARSTEASILWNESTTAGALFRPACGGLAQGTRK